MNAQLRRIGAQRTETLKALLHRLLPERLRLAGQLYIGLGGAVALTLTASLIAWFSFGAVGEAQDLVTEEILPEMEAAYGIAQRSGTLVAAAPRLTAATSAVELEEIGAQVRTERDALEARLTDLLRAGGETERFTRIRSLSRELTSNIDAVEASVAEGFDLSAHGAALLAELNAIRDSLESELVPAMDDQYFYAMTGYRELGRPPVRRSQFLKESEIQRYRYLLELHSDLTDSTELMTHAFNLSDSALLEPLRERFEAAAGRIDRNLGALGQRSIAPEVRPGLEQLIQLGLGEGGCFPLRERQLAILDRQHNLLAENRELRLVLVGEVDGLVSEARLRMAHATQSAGEAIQIWWYVLLGLNAFGILGAVLIAWLYVGRVLVSRLAQISDRMHKMAAGDLRTKVEIGGRDEIAEMGQALELFRQKAIEARRLNLAEKLADELRGKNQELEAVLTDLHKAQDQIVAREKLAALGELTAGVAHEIRNPLNFVKNFSEVSGELLEELQETLEHVGEGLDEDQQEDVKEICADLVENLDCIRNHSNRANRIVLDMLMMGRDSGERMETDINTLIWDNAQLAFHSARATDPDFQLEIQQDFDPEAGCLEVVPQEMGRVILNMVSNSCQATHAKRQGNAGNGYDPTLRLTTRRVDGRVEIRVRDNGSGIPPEAIEKIFNPFFTTKPTNQGTGLGLSMSNDIVRKHGGTVRVESELGTYTEMIIELPTGPGAAE